MSNSKSEKQCQKQDNLNSIGKHLKDCRNKQNLSQETVAEKCGLTGKYIGAIERGEKLPSIPTLISIMNALDADPNVIFSEVMICPEYHRFAKYLLMGNNSNITKDDCEFLIGIGELYKKFKESTPETKCH